MAHHQGGRSSSHPSCKTNEMVVISLMFAKLLYPVHFESSTFFCCCVHCVLFPKENRANSSDLPRAKNVMAGLLQPRRQIFGTRAYTDDALQIYNQEALVHIPDLFTDLQCYNTVILVYQNVFRHTCTR